MNHEIESTLENDFKDLVEYAQSSAGFHRGAKLLLGKDYVNLGRQILEGDKLMSKLEQHLADQSTT